MKIIITGCNGLLARDIKDVFADYQLFLFDRYSLDITDDQSLEREFKRIYPDLLINCAAYTKVDDCENNRDLAYSVNGVGPANLARLSAKYDSVLLHFSTDYIFSGNNPEGYVETDRSDETVNEYGKSKLMGERGIFIVSEKTGWNKYYICRISWLYGKGGGNFVNTMLSLSQTKKELSVVNDQYGVPCYSKDVARTVRVLIDQKMPYGVYHPVNEGKTTWYEFAREIFRNQGLCVRVVPCGSEKFPRPAKRPKYSCLINNKLPILRHWKDALQEYLSNNMENKNIFNKNYPQINGVYICFDETKLSDNTHENQVKKMEMSTYSERGDKFDIDLMRLSERDTKMMRPLLSLDKYSPILELGGGNGKFAIELMRRGYNVIESDIAYGSVNRAKEFAGQLGVINGTYAVIDAENIPFMDKSLGAVFMVASLHHLPNPQKAIKEINRVLSDDGRLIILREPASWSYCLFFPMYWLLRKVLRRLNKNSYSLADDETFGFSLRTFKKLLVPYFSNIKFIPVDYTRKYYANWLVLKSKLMKKQYTGHPAIFKFLKTLDHFIEKIPVIKRLPWDWDVVCGK